MSFYDDASLVLIPSAQKTSKVYSVKPTDGTGDLTFTRASTATRVNSSGLIEAVASNVPRLDYLGSTCPRLLLEPQRTNFLTYSEDLSNAIWALSSATISTNATTAPDGTLTADKFIGTATNAVHFFQQSAVSSSYVFSIYAKAGEENVFSMWISNTSKRAEFNLTTGTIPLSTVANSSIVNVGNGWYRCSVYDSSPTTTYRIYGRTGASYLGNGVNGMFFWGAQLEAGSYATSYIPTTAASVTRVADVCLKTGISSLIGQTEGVLFVNAVLTHSTGATNEYLAQVNASANNRILIYRQNSTNKLGAILIVGGAVIYSVITSGAITSTAKVAFAYKSGDFAFYVNGTQVGTSSATYTTPPSMGSFDLDSNGGTENGFYSYNQALLFKTRLTNAQLAELTAL